MSSLVDKLTAQESEGSGDALNDLVSQLWPNINVAGSDLIKDTVGPMLKTSLPAPLNNLNFTKVDLGNVPLRLTNVVSTKTETQGIKVDMNLDWEGKCDIELDGDMVPALGIESLHLHGRLSILLCPLTNVLPLVGAAQVSFVNPPELKLDFTGAANVADLGIVDGAVRGVVLDTLNSLVTLPNRYLYKVDNHNDFFKTYLHPLGIVRITVEKAWNFAQEPEATTTKIWSKITRADPDCYAKVNVGAEEAWKTGVKNNTTTPAWNETHDFVVSDLLQCVKVDIEDQDVNADDEIGIAVTTVREIVSNGPQLEMPLIREGQETGGRVSLNCQYFPFEASNNSFSSSDHTGEGRLCGLATILIAGAFGIKGARQELSPSVVVTWGEQNRFRTSVITDAPGTDINNPTFDQTFRIPFTVDMVGSKANDFRIAVLNGENEVAGVDVPYGDVLKAKDQVLQDTFNVGNGTSVKASICLRGLSGASAKSTILPERLAQQGQ